MNKQGLKMIDSDHRLVLKISTPKVVDEGKTFKVDYNVKNIGKNVFPAKSWIKVRVSWEDTKYWFVQHILIKKDLKPKEENETISYKLEPLTTKYTCFEVEEAIASDGKNVRVFSEDEISFLFPLTKQVIQGKKVSIRQLLHSVRTRTTEEKSRSMTQWLTVISLLAVVGLQIIDWILQYFKTQ